MFKWYLASLVGALVFILTSVLLIKLLALANPEVVQEGEMGMLGIGLKAQVAALILGSVSAFMLSKNHRILAVSFALSLSVVSTLIYVFALTQLL